MHVSHRRQHCRRRSPHVHSPPRCLTVHRQPPTLNDHPPVDAKLTQKQKQHETSKS